MKKLGSQTMLEVRLEQLKNAAQDVAVELGISEQSREKHEGCVRAFHHTKAAYYSEIILRDRDCSDEVMFGFYARDGGTSGEMGMRWVDIKGKPTPKITVFNDTFDALAEMADVMQMLRAYDNKRITPEQFCNLLLSLGFEDFTKRDEVPEV